MCATTDYPKQDSLNNSYNGQNRRGRYIYVWMGQQPAAVQDYRR
jgi:hypothetical protein